MSITDELREWWVRKFPIMDKELHDDFTAIADRIDAEHEKALDENERLKVVRLMLEDENWWVGFDRCAGWAELSIHEWHHYHAPTVEDVLREFAAKLCIRDGFTEATEETFAEYAAKLRLAEGEDA